MRIRWFVLAAMLCAPFALHGQATPDAREVHIAKEPERFQLYGGYSFQSNTFNGLPGHTQSLYGWEAAFGFPYLWRGLRFVADVTDYRGTNYGAPQNAYAITGGFQYDQKIGSRETLFGDIRAGDIGINQDWGPNRQLGGTTSFTTIMGGGLDSRISRRFAFRVAGDFVYENLYLWNNDKDRLPFRYPGQPNYFGHITTGVVWKF